MISDARYSVQCNLSEAELPEPIGVAWHGSYRRLCKSGI